MYICPYATVNKIGFACEYKDEAMYANRDLGLIDEPMRTKSYIKRIEPMCPSDVRRGEDGTPICWQVCKEKNCKQGGSKMVNKGFCVISTKKNNAMNVYTIATLDFIENNKNAYRYNDSYLCDSYKILENVGGQVIVELFQKMEHSRVKIKTTLKFEKDIIIDIKAEDLIC